VLDHVPPGVGAWRRVADRQNRQTTARHRGQDERVVGGGETTAVAADALAGARAVVLVEGLSDQFALQALAQRRGRRLDAEGVLIQPMGGATNIGRFLAMYGPAGLDLRLAGLCDAAEEGYFRRALERAGLGRCPSRAGMEALGFYVCVADLEDELIRCLGTTAVQEIIEAQGELGSFRTLRQQPAQQGRSTQALLRRFMGTRSGRKRHYARLLAEALDPDQAPRPLDRLLAHV